MVIKLQSANLYDLIESGSMDANQIEYAYNALDSAVTLRVHERLAELLQNNPPATRSYRFVRAMQGPALEMMRTGVMTQQKVRADETVRYTQLKEQAQALLDQFANAIWGPEEYEEVTKTKEIYTPTGKRGQDLAPRYRTVVVRKDLTRLRGLNPSSSKQVLALFNDALGFPVHYEIRKTPHGTERSPSANDKALRKWAKLRVRGPGIAPRDRIVRPIHLAQPLVSLILTIRDCDKMLTVLRTPLDADGRMRCSYNVAGTENARWSSSRNVYGRGTNLQNITSTMRRMFCADDGYIAVSTDLEQAESRLVAGCIYAACGDLAYWNACESGDLHTTVCQMAWPELEWTSDPKANRKIADTEYPNLGGYTYRDVAKRLGHGSNYAGSAYGIAEHVGIPLRVVEEFQERYFRAFPAHAIWHRWIKSQLEEHKSLETPLPFGRRRLFFGRSWEASTLREAIAYVPQSTIGELLNLVLLNCWTRSKLALDNPRYLPIQILLQNHDAFLFQTKHTPNLPQIITEVNREFQSAPLTFTHNGVPRQMIIPGEFVTGFNWGYEDSARKNYADGNPDGLRKWKGADTRTRVQSARTSPSDWLSGTIPRTY